MRASFSVVIYIAGFVTPLSLGLPTPSQGHSNMTLHSVDQDVLPRALCGMKVISFGNFACTCGVTIISNIGSTIQEQLHF